MSRAPKPAAVVPLPSRDVLAELARAGWRWSAAIEAVLTAYAAGEVQPEAFARAMAREEARLGRLTVRLAALEVVRTKRPAAPGDAMALSGRSQALRDAQRAHVIELISYTMDDPELLAEEGAAFAGLLGALVQIARDPRLQEPPPEGADA